MAAPTTTSPRQPSQPTVASYCYFATPVVDTDFAVPFDAVLLTATMTTVIIRTLDGTDLALTNFPANTILPIRGTSIRLGTTTIANVRCLWS